jgi:hypothetical protein
LQNSRILPCAIVFLLATAGLVAITITPGRSGTEVPNLLAPLVGSWRVVSVDLKPALVQALAPNDPADLGAVLVVSIDRLSWQPGKGDAFSDVCEAPHLGQDGTVSCDKGSFGFPGATLTTSGQGIRLEWYDNAILNLERINAR